MQLNPLKQLTSPEAKTYFELIKQFTKRDLKTRYSNSILGVLWILFYPISITIIASLIFSVVFKGFVQEIPYYLFAIIGLISWNFFAQTQIYATRSLVWNSTLITSTNFHKETIIFAVSLSKLIDYLINMAVFVVLLYFSHPHALFSLTTYLYFTLLLLCQLLFQTGLALITASLNVYYRDIQNILDIALQVLFYLTPVIFPLSIIPQQFRIIINLNPLTHILTLQRQVFFQQLISGHQVLLVVIISTFTFILGFKLFKVLEKKFAEKI